jgi:hypothetical protein
MTTGGRLSSSRARASLGLVAALTIVATWTPPSAQSLADVARVEAERRAALKAAARVITDKDLQPERPSLPMAPRAPEPARGEQGVAPATAEADGAGDAVAKEPAAGADAAARPPVPPERRDEHYWRARFTATRQAVARAEDDASAVQGRIRELDRALEEPGHGARRGELTGERASAARSLEALQRRLAHVRAEWAALEALARNLDVPTDWTR